MRRTQRLRRRRERGRRGNDRVLPPKTVKILFSRSRDFSVLVSLVLQVKAL